MKPRRAEILYPAAELAGRARRLARGDRCPLHRGEPLAPFFVVGSGRSGTTLLRRLLQASPELHVPPELHALGEAIRVYRRNCTLPWPELVRATLGVFAFDRTFDEFGLDPRELAERIDRLAPGRRSLAALLDALYRTHAERSGKAQARWGDKTPLNAFALGAILAVFPRARFVHVVRDGVDVCHSFVRASLQPDLGAAAARWRDSVAAVRAFAERHPARCHELRYEALVREPRATAAALFDFLGTRFDAAWVEPGAARGELRDLEPHAHLRGVFAPIGTRSLGRGRRELTPDDRRRLQRLIGADLAGLGYPPADA